MASITVTDTFHRCEGGLRTKLYRDDGATITVSTILTAFDHGGPETCLFATPVDLLDPMDAVTRHDDDLTTHHEAGIARAREILEGTE